MKRVVAIVIAVLMVFSLVGCASKSTDKSDDSYVISTENFGFTKGEMTYLYNYVLNQNGSYVSMMGIDLEKSLKDQMFEENKSWFDFFMEEASLYAEDFLLFCEQAKARGLDLTDEDLEKIKNEIEALNGVAKEAGFDTADAYLEDFFGKGVTAADYENFIKKSVLASKAYSEIINSYSFTDEEVQNYYNENPKKFLYVDYASHTFMADEANGITKADMKKKADELAASSDLNAFLAYAKDSSPEKDPFSFTNNRKGYLEGDAFSEWAYSDEANVNTIYQVSNEESGMYTVFYLIKKPYRDDSFTVNIRHILLTETTYQSDEAASKKAEEVLSEFKGGAATTEFFGELAAKYSEDPGSAQGGGAYFNVKEGDMVAEFNDWIFDASRQAGDNGIVKTSFGYHVMFFESKGAEVWKNEVESALKQDVYSADYESFKEAHPVTVDKDALKTIEG